MRLRPLKQNDCGAYVLILFLPRGQTIRVGALGLFDFARGWYGYIGSGMNGLNARIARHIANAQRSLVSDRLLVKFRSERLRQREKKLFWHIDYFVRHARVIAVETRRSPRRFECRTARKILSRPTARIVAPRFGASDCDCPAHLIYFVRRPRGKNLL